MCRNKVANNLNERDDSGTVTRLLRAAQSLREESIPGTRATKRRSTDWHLELTLINQLTSLLQLSRAAMSLTSIHGVFVLILTAFFFARPLPILPRKLPLSSF